MTDETNASPPGHHIPVDELADAAERLLPADQAARVSAHLDVCADCTALAAALTDVCTQLRDEPPVQMPDSVFQRLSAVVRSEAERRADGAQRAEETETCAAQAKAIGSFGADPESTHNWGIHYRRLRPGAHSRTGE